MELLIVYFLKLPLTSPLLGPNILLKTLFSDIVDL
jgi:hypothetical protein